MDSTTSRRPEVLAKVVVGGMVALALAQVALVALPARGPEDLGSADFRDLVLNALLALALAALALVVVFRIGEKPYARALGIVFANLSLVHGLMVSVIWTDNVYMSAADPDALRPLMLALVTSVAALYAVGFAAMLRFAALFPRAVQPSAVERYIERHPSPHGPRFDRGNLTLMRAFLRPEVVWGGAVIVPSVLLLFTAAVMYDVLGGLAFALFIGFAPVAPVLCVSATVLLLRASFDSGTPDDRRRLLWILWGVGTSAGLLLFVLVANTLSAFVFFDHTWIGEVADSPLEFYAPVMVLESSLAIAVLYRGDIDPRLAIRRTTVYGALSVAFLFLFAGLGNAAEGFLESSLSMPPFAGSMFTGGTIAVALIPVKRRLDGFVSRILPVTVLAEAPTHEIAILFSDIVGFTALSGVDQKAGLTVMSIFHKAADRVAREHRGRFVKAVADEVLLEFRNPEDAVRAAGELQGEFHEAARELDLPTPAIRAGIHYGEATRSRDGDLFGDTVSIASRVQGVAGPGEVVLSQAVRERLAPGAFTFKDLGPQALKNVATVVACYRLEGGHG